MSTDELPSPSPLRRILCLAAVGGVGYLGVVILILSLATTEFNPVTQLASDYGVGPFAWAMNSGFFLAGVGFLALSAGTFLSERRRSVGAGASLLVPAAVALIANAFFQTDLEGAAKTLHGTIHGFDGAVFFLAAPAGLLLLSRRFNGRWTGHLAVAFMVAFASLALPPLFGLDVGGLGERILILVVFSTAILTALRTMREA